LIKINRKKLVPKLILAILLITLITGFACTFVTAKADQRSTRLDFEATEVLTLWDPYEMWWEGDIMHMRAYKEADTSGTIDEIEFTGWNKLYLHNKIDTVTGDIIAHGNVAMYIEWKGLEGTFYGIVNAKGNAMGVFDGKFVLQGAGDFEGMKLFGILWVIDPEYGVNGLSGTILVPN